MLRKEIGEICERGNNSKREFGVEPQLGFEEFEHASMTPRTSRREMQDMRTIRSKCNQNRIRNIYS
jgi:hypothetical protein